jgi:hypothetical protein
MAGAAVVAAMVWCGGASAATVITDPPGDANGGANAGLGLATAPASDATRDLTRVTVSSTAGALSVAFETSAPLTPGTLPTFVTLHATAGTCPVRLMAWLDGVQAQGTPVRVATADSVACGGFITQPGYSLSGAGTKLVARFPYAALARNRVPITASTPLTHLSADTRVGTYTTLFYLCGGNVPHLCDTQGSFRQSLYLGPLVDATG